MKDCCCFLIAKRLLKVIVAIAILTIVPIAFQDDDDD